MTRRPFPMGVDEHPWNAYTPEQRRAAVLGQLRTFDHLRLTEHGYPDRRFGGQTATQVAWALGVPPARRAGRGAVGGSWTGDMSPALRVAPTLGSLVRSGMAERARNPTDPHPRAAPLYYLTAEGERALEDSTKRTP